MKYTPYLKYNNSEIDLLGIIPDHWEKINIKRKFKIVNGSTPKSSVLDNWDGDIIWITPADFSNEENGYINHRGGGTRGCPCLGYYRRDGFSRRIRR